MAEPTVNKDTNVEDLLYVSIASQRITQYLESVRAQRGGKADLETIKDIFKTAAVIARVGADKSLRG